jgi:apolipoprotein N-acyltransferase
MKVRNRKQGIGTGAEVAVECCGLRLYWLFTALIYTRRRMLEQRWMRWAAAGLSAGLLELPFPLAGPMPPWRSVFAWFGLAPLIWAVLRMSEDAERPLRRSFLVAYLCGFLWYMGNCYWVRDTMARYGDMPTLAPVMLLVAFSLVLGLYFGLFGLGIAVVRRRGLRVCRGISWDIRRWITGS